MSNSLMSLVDCFVKSLTIETNALVRPMKSIDRLPANVNITIQQNIMQDGQYPLQFLIPLGITVTWPEQCQSTYIKIAIELNGLFSFPEGTPEEQIRQYVPLLCLTNLFGIARGIIAQATGNCAEGAFYLPLVNMTEILQNAVANTTESVSAPEQALEQIGNMESASIATAKRRTRRKTHRQ